MNSSDLLHIRILAVEQIYPFETAADESDSSPDDDLRLVRDPFPVVAIREQGFLLLQDTDRFQSVVRAGLIHVPVQIVREPALKLCCETLSLPGLENDDLMAVARRNQDDIIPARPDQSVPDGYYPVYVRFASGDSTALFLRHSAGVGCPEGLTRLFAEIGGSGRYLPLVETSSRHDQLLKGGGSETALTIPGFTIADLRMAAASGELFPAHVIRVVPDCRVLAIDFPASVLKADIPLEEKQAFLQDLIALREQANRTSIVEGRVYILNR